MKRVIKYIIISERNITSLENSVQDYIAVEGFEPFGDLKIIDNPITCIQAMIKYEHYYE